MITLDVHILTLDSTKPEYLEQALESIKVAAERCTMDVGVNVVEGVPNHLGLSRKKGYSVGTAEYVTHVDHDDWIHEDALAKVEQALTEHKPEGLTTGEFLVGAKHIPRPTHPHHLAVFRREWLEKQEYEQYEFYVDHYLVAMSDAIHIPECLYYHRVDPSSASRVQRSTFPKQAAEEGERIKDKKLMLIEHMTSTQLARLLDQEIDNG